MITLPDNTTDRLLAVADIIEFTPERWQQQVWFNDGEESYDFPALVIGRGSQECGTVGCVAGWAVALSALTPWGASFELAGAQALGITGYLADDLFDGGLALTLDHHEMADILRRLAKLPEGGRDIDAARTVLTAKQCAVLFGDDDE